MSSSVLKDKLKFLLDENVKKDLLLFLKSAGYDVTFKPKGLSNGKLAAFSKSDKRVLVTNDSDFASFTRDKIFSVVWLKIPQDKPEKFVQSFEILLKDKSKMEDFEGFLIVLEEKEFKSRSLRTKKFFE